MRWLSCHFGTLRRNEQAYCGNLEQIWRARDTNQQHLSYWVFPAPHSPIIDTPQKVTKMIVLPLLLLIQSSDTFASNAFLEVEDREWRLFCGFWPPAHPPPLWQVPLTITLPIRAATAQNQPAASPPPSSSPSLATTPSLKNTCFNIWTDAVANLPIANMVKISQRNNGLGVNSTNWSACSILSYPMIWYDRQHRKIISTARSS